MRFRARRAGKYPPPLSVEKTPAFWGVTWILTLNSPRTVTKILRVSSKGVHSRLRRWRRSPLGDQWGRGSQITGVCEIKAVVAACFRPGGLFRKAPFNDG